MNAAKTPIPKVTQKRKGQLTAELLLRNIPGAYAPGDRLPPERQLARELGVSRNTLREAIAALCLAGLLELRHCSGTFVRTMPDLEQASGMIASVFAANVDLFAILDARIAFEPGIARLACGTATQADFDSIRSQLDTLVDALERRDSATYSAADREFHLSIARATHNKLIVQTLKPLLQPLHTPLWLTMKGNIDNETAVIAGRIQQHKKIFFALYNREPGLAEELMRGHLQLSKTRLAGSEEV